MEFGTVRAMLPGSSLILCVDGITIEASGMEYADVLVVPGYHDIKYYLNDGSKMYERTVRVDGGNVTTVRPDIPDAMKSGLDAAWLAKYLKAKNEAEDNDLDYFPAQYGLAIGIDSSDISSIVQLLNEDHIRYSGYPSLYSLSCMYIWRFDARYYADLSFGALTASTPGNAPTLSCMQIGVGVKYKLNNFLMIGGRPTLSMWGLSIQSSRSQFSPGLELFIDITSIDLEVGFVERSITKDPGNSGEPAGSSITPSGMYCRYKALF